MYGLFQVLGIPASCEYTWNIKCDSNLGTNASSKWLVAFTEIVQVGEWLGQDCNFSSSL